MLRGFKFMCFVSMSFSANNFCINNSVNFLIFQNEFLGKPSEQVERAPLEVVSSLRYQLQCKIVLLTKEDLATLNFVSPCGRNNFVHFYQGEWGIAWRLCRQTIPHSPRNSKLSVISNEVRDLINH